MALKGGDGGPHPVLPSGLVARIDEGNGLPPLPHSSRSLVVQPAASSVPVSIEVCQHTNEHRGLCCVNFFTLDSAAGMGGSSQAMQEPHEVQIPWDRPLSPTRARADVVCV